MKARLSTDGGARGNPGPAAYGYVLETEDGTVLDARGDTIGVATNNVAEYSGLIAGLESALKRDVTELEVVSDSELLVKQMRGEYKVKSPTLRELVDEAQALAGRLGSVGYTAVRREHNELADAGRERRLEPCEERAVLGDVVRRDPDRIAAGVEHRAVLGLEDVRERGRARVAAGAPVGEEAPLHVSASVYTS